MNLLQRFGYYFGGFAVGLVILAFFLNGKRVSCSYGPEARVIKNITSKTLKINTTAMPFLRKQNIDSTQLNSLLKKSSVNFSKSETHKKPCNTYQLEGNIKNKKALILIENCDKMATIKSIKWLNN